MYSNEIGQRQQITNSIAIDSPSLRPQTARTGEAAEAKPAAPAKDEARISAAASQMASHLSDAAGISDVRTEKVAALQLAIQNGSYKVSASDVADKVIQSMLG